MEYISKTERKRQALLRQREYNIQYGRIYYAKNKQQLLEKQHEYNRKTRKEQSARNKRYVAEHKEQVSQYKAEWYQNNKERMRAKQALNYLANKDRHRDKMREYRATHPEYNQDRHERRRARKLLAPINDFTKAQWLEMKVHYGHRCVYCGKKFERLTMDHITPFVRGGSHTRANIVPACRSCNSKKHAGPVLKPIQPLLL